MVPLRVALVGLGNAGFKLHLPALAGIPAARVVGACDLDANRRAQASTRWQVPVFPDFDGMMAETAPEVVIIGTPPATHADYCRRALLAGAHVVCEKPFVSSLAEADSLIDLARRVGRRIAVNHEFRSMPIFRALLDEVAGPPAREVFFAQVWQLMDLPPWAEPGWRGQMLQRTLYEAGIHLVDLLVALFGERPLAVTSVMSTCGVREGQTDAVALVTLEFSRGRLGHIVQNRLCKGETQYFEVRAETAETSLRASFGGRARLSTGLFRAPRPHLRLEFGISGMAWREEGPHRTFLARNPADPGMVATRDLLTRTLAAFAADQPPPVDATAARDLLEVIVACYHAAATGTRIEIDSPAVRSLASLQLGAAVSM